MAKLPKRPQVGAAEAYDGQQLLRVIDEVIPGP